MKIKPERSFYIPAGAVCVRDKLSSAVAYLYTNPSNLPAAVVFQGRRQKPDWKYRFASAAQRELRVKAHFERVREFESAKKVRQNEPHMLKVGDVLRASWGYDQTNIDYYEVTRLVGKSMVEIRELAQESEETGWLQGKTVPVPGKYRGDPMRKLARRDYVKIESYAYAYRVEPREPAPGVKVYDADHYTSYH